MLQHIQLKIVRNAPIEEDKNKFTYQTISFDDNSINSDYEKALYQSRGICWALTSHLFQNFSLREGFNIFYLSFDIPIADFRRILMVIFLDVCGSSWETFCGGQQ